MHIVLNILNTMEKFKAEKNIQPNIASEEILNKYKTLRNVLKIWEEWDVKLLFLLTTTLHI